MQTRVWIESSIERFRNHNGVVRNNEVAITPNPSSPSSGMLKTVFCFSMSVWLRQEEWCITENYISVAVCTNGSKNDSATHHDAIKKHRKWQQQKEAMVPKLMASLFRDEISVLYSRSKPFLLSFGVCHSIVFENAVLPRKLPSFRCAIT